MKKYVELEDVIQRLDNAIYCSNEGEFGYDEALKRLRIAYSETMPTIEVSEDCISRKWLEECREVICYKNMWRETEVDEFVSWKNIENAPSVIPSRSQGEWLFDPKDAIDSMFARPKCSNCDFESADGGKFCSNCGAEMKGVIKRTWKGTRCISK